MDDNADDKSLVEKTVETEKETQGSRKTGTTEEIRR
jgi:hypothetical protein